MSRASMAGERWRIIVIITAALYAAIAGILSFYFVFFNNSTIILYSFLVFVALGLIIAHKEKFIKLSTLASISIIVISSLAYLYVQKNAYSAFAINFAIIGYYLLISTVIALFASIVAADNNMHPLKKAASALAAQRRYLFPLLLAIGALAIALPLWPMGSAINYSILPHASLYINSIDNPMNQTQNSTYLLIINLSNYSKFTNPQGSNLRIKYPNGTDVRAAEYDIGGIQVGNYTEKMLIESHISNGSVLEIYFLPFNYSFGANFSSITAKRFDSKANGSYTVASTIGNISGVIYKQVNETITAYAANKMTNYDNYTFELLPPYSLQTVCSMGNYSHVTINITSNKTMSVFFFDNLSDFSDSVVNVSQSYGSYLRAFGANGEKRVINASNMHESLALNGCIYYSLVVENQTRIALHTVQNYISYTPYTEVKSFELPSLPKAMQKRSGFVWDSIYYTFVHAVYNESNASIGV
ncbi:MAG: hypothetical protein QXW10_00715 [Candidatus Micrarchaeaceae archaeon]